MSTLWSTVHLAEELSFLTFKKFVFESFKEERRTVELHNQGSVVSVTEQMSTNKLLGTEAKCLQLK